MAWRAVVEAPAVTRLLRCRWVLLPALAVLVGHVASNLSADMARFSAVGQLVLEGRLGAVYDTAWNQAGPVQLVLSRALMIGGHGDMPAAVVVYVINAGLVLAAMSACRGLAADRRARAHREVLVGLLTLLWLAAAVPWTAHPVELAIPLCWMAAIVLQRRGRWWWAVVVLAFGVAVAPWAVLGYPCLLAAGHLWRAVRTGALAGVLGVLCYLPFVVTGNFAMFEMQWVVNTTSLVHLLAPSLSAVTWPMRLIQGVVVAGGCTLLAWRWRHRALAVALAPLGAALLRVLTDPLQASYYWTAVAATSIVAVALVPATAAARQRILIFLLGYLPVLAHSPQFALPGAVICLGLLLAVTWTSPISAAMPDPQKRPAVVH